MRTRGGSRCGLHPRAGAGGRGPVSPGGRPDRSSGLRLAVMMMSVVAVVAVMPVAAVMAVAVMVAARTRGERVHAVDARIMFTQSTPTSQGRAACER